MLVPCLLGQFLRAEEGRPGPQQRLEHRELLHRQVLTLASVARRVREFGSLKALGWQDRRITVQVLAEIVTVGIAGTLAGVVSAAPAPAWSPPA